MEAKVIIFFTDGSGLSPEDRRLRIATWEVVVADLDSDHFLILSQGGVPGVVQTVLRAELLAVISALEWMNLYGKPGILWIDNEQVWTTVEAFRKGGSPCENTSNDYGIEHMHFVLRLFQILF